MIVVRSAPAYHDWPLLFPGDTEATLLLPLLDTGSAAACRITARTLQSEWIDVAMDTHTIIGKCNGPSTVLQWTLEQ